MKYATHKKSWLAAILLAFIVIGLTPRLTLAHAQFVRSNPAANSTLEKGKPPATIQVWFSEAIEPSFSKLEVYDKNQQQVDKRDSKVAPDDEKSLIVSLPVGLPDGPYTVVFSNVSREDGHAVKSSFGFVVGEGVLPASTGIGGLLDAQADTNAANFNFWSVSLRWLNYLGMAGLVGALIFLLLVWRPVSARASAKVGPELEQASETTYKMTRRLVGWSLIVLAIGWLTWTVYQASTASSSPPWKILSNGALLDLLFDSRFGVVWGARLALIIMAYVLWAMLSGKIGNFGVPMPRAVKMNIVPESDAPAVPVKPVASIAAPPVLWWVLLVVALGLLLTTSLNSHAAAEKSALLLVPADWLHLVSTGFWVGGLFAMALVLPPALKKLVPGSGDRTRLLAEVIPTFSIMAILAVALLFITGTLQAAVHLGTTDALLSTGYGLSLTIKLALLVPILGLGAYHLLKVSPAMRQFARRKSEAKGAGSVAAGTLQTSFRRTVWVEAVLMVGLLIAVGALTSFSPAQQNGVAQSSGPLIVRGTADNLKYAVAISPAIVGENAFEIELTDQNGTPLPATTVIIGRFNHLDMEMGVQDVQFKPVSGKPGRFTAQASVLSMTGNWETSLIVRRDGFDEVRVPVKFAVKS